MIDVSKSDCYVGDCRDLLAQLPERCVQTCVTSPPYWGLRDYGVDNQLGLEQSPAEYVGNMVDVFRGVRRVLRDDGTLWLNLGDSYVSTPSGITADSMAKSGLTSRGMGKKSAALKTREMHSQRGRKDFGDHLKTKDLVGIPWMVAFALREDGWYLRNDIIWHKPNPMPESVTDRCTKSHEYVFLMSKSERYFYCIDAIREAHTAVQRSPGAPRPGKAVGPMDRGGASQWETERSAEDSYHPLGRNKRDVWTIASQPYDGAHFATMPPDLVKPCVLAGSRTGDIVFDPFFGSGTTGMVAESLGRRWIGFDINPEYQKLQRQRTAQRGLAL